MVKVSSNIIISDRELVRKKFYDNLNSIHHELAMRLGEELLKNNLIEFEYIELAQIQNSPYQSSTEIRATINIGEKQWNY